MNTITQEQDLKGSEKAQLELKKPISSTYPESERELQEILEQYLEKQGYKIKVSSIRKAQKDRTKLQYCDILAISPDKTQIFIELKNLNTGSLTILGTGVAQLLFERNRHLTDIQNNEFWLVYNKPKSSRLNYDNLGLIIDVALLKGIKSFFFNIERPKIANIELIPYGENE